MVERRNGLVEVLLWVSVVSAFAGTFGWGGTLMRAVLPASVATVDVSALALGMNITMGVIALVCVCAAYVIDRERKRSDHA